MTVKEMLKYSFETLYIALFLIEALPGNPFQHTLAFWCGNNIIN